MLYVYLWDFKIIQGVKKKAQRVSTPTTIILPRTVSPYYSLNCFGNVLYVLQTSMYQNSAKLLTHPSNKELRVKKNNAVKNEKQSKTKKTDFKKICMIIS